MRRVHAANPHSEWSPPPTPSGSVTPQTMRFVVLLAAAYAALLSVLTLWKYRYYLYTDFDLAAWNQVLWNTLHGRFFYFSIRDITWFYHFPVIMLLLLPIYALFQRPEFLLVLLSLGLAAGAMPVYLLASHEMGKRWGIFWACIYLLYPPIASINLFEFHADGLSIPFWLGAMYAFRLNRFKSFVACLVLALSCKELYVIPTAMFSVYALAHRRSKPWILAPLVLSSAWYLVGAKLITPLLIHSELRYEFFFPAWERTPRALITQLIRDPRLLVTVALQKAKLVYLFQLFSPLAFLSLVAPSALVIPLPTLALHLASSFPGLYSTTTHYTAPIVPFLLIAGIAGLQRILAACADTLQRRIVSAFFGLSILVSCLAQHPIPRLVEVLPRAFTDPLTPVRDALITSIPDRAPCVATFRLLPHLSNRRFLFSLHQIYLGKDYYTQEPYTPAVPPDYALIDVTDPMTFDTFFTLEGAGRLRRFFDVAEWGVQQVVGPLVLLKRQASPKHVLIQALDPPNQIPTPLGVFDDALEWLEEDHGLEDSPVGPLLHIRLTWRLRAQHGEKYILELVASSPPGRAVTVLHQDVGYELTPTNA